MMDSTENERMSVLLSKFLERYLAGTQETVDIDRKAYALLEKFQSFEPLLIFSRVGSTAEGLHLKGSDEDSMIVHNDIKVMLPGQCIPRNMAHRTILYTRAADCRPGYVYLQPYPIQQTPMSRAITDTLVKIGNSIFVSSYIFRERIIRISCKNTGRKFETNGPACKALFQDIEQDFVDCLPCLGWPKEAAEWITRPRLYGWPHQTIIDHIVHRGCHLVPVGDKCSENTFLQWRLSFTIAERCLVHSFSHIQFKVYALLKCFLKQIKEDLKETVGDDDILCSYFLKTILFHAIENSSHMFWKEKNLFQCFRFCLKLLIAWVRAGFCPNYFIPANNLFKRKVHGQHQQILLEVLSNCYQMKWMCLSLGNYIKPTIWERLSIYLNQPQLVSPMSTLDKVKQQDEIMLFHLRQTNALVLPSCICSKFMFRKAMKLLITSESESDEVLTFAYLIKCLQRLATEQVYPEHRVATDNKTRYRSLRKCKHWMIPRASMGTERLYLATFHFLTGNFLKTKRLCNEVMNLARCYSLCVFDHPEEKAMYRHVYHQFERCSDRLQKLYTFKLSFTKEDLYLPHLCQEMFRSPKLINIPPLPYALFLTFLCCHELGDTSGRDAALRLLIEARSDDEQGGHRFWIVHNLLGICYQTLGDNERAIRAYWDSAQSKAEEHVWGLAIERIAVVYLCMYARQYLT